MIGVAGCDGVKRRRGPALSRKAAHHAVIAIMGVLCASSPRSAQGAEQGASCPFSSPVSASGIVDDGCSGADREPAQYPKMLEPYGKRRPPFNVAGIDYHVGVPANVALRDPTMDALPEGCDLKDGLVTCTKNNTTLSGYDFSLHEVRLYIPEGVSGTVIANNKFAIGPACKDPLIDIRKAGSTTISHNTFDGAGALCPNPQFGTLIFSVYPAGAVSTVEYNEFRNIPEDALQYAGPSSGAASIILRYNLFYIQGFTGHPDGFQANGGNFDPIAISFNTYYNTSPPAKGAQPFHVEAQLTAALNHSKVSYNTIVTPGQCNGGHGRCVANSDIACKKDDGKNTNANFSAYGNFIDSSGAMAPFHGESGCTGASWGVPVPNRDLKTGGLIPRP